MCCSLSVGTADAPGEGRPLGLRGWPGPHSVSGWGSSMGTPALSPDPGQRAPDQLGATGSRSCGDRACELQVPGLPPFPTDTSH